MKMNSELSMAYLPIEMTHRVGILHISFYGITQGLF